MAKRLVASIEKRLRQVLVPRDQDAPAPQIDVARGNIELRDVKVNEEFLQKRSSLPFMIRDSTIRRVSVHCDRLDSVALAALMTQCQLVS